MPALPTSYAVHSRNDIGWRMLSRARMVFGSFERRRLDVHYRRKRRK